MALGTAVREQRFENPRELLGERLRGVYRLLAEVGGHLFPDDYFADLYSSSARGRPTVPARVVATVMLLQAHEGLSDTDATEHLGRDLAWQAAAGVGTGAEAFHPTLLVGVRNRLRASARPRRLFEDTRAAAQESGVLGRRARVVDSTPLFDAVATQDTVTQLRSAIRRLLRAMAGSSLGARVRLALRRDDDYEGPGKPPCDWNDPVAGEALVDALVADGRAALEALEGADLDPAAREAAELLALVVGQDVEAGEDGVFRIARKVARDRVVSTVDPEARHGHKSRDRHFDGYKTHASVDPDSELIDEVVVTPANSADRDAVDDLLADHAEDEDKPDLYGDSAYADADTLERLDQAGYRMVAKVPPARGRVGCFGKDDFDIDLEVDTVSCPAGHDAAIIYGADGSGRTSFAQWCGPCPLRERCTTSAAGRSVTIHPKEGVLQRHKAEQAEESWQDDYRSTRPKVERKIAHFVRAVWGGRRARTRGVARVRTDVDTRAAVLNWARLDVLGVHFDGSAWVGPAPP